jgi:hypothetical protein
MVYPLLEKTSQVMLGERNHEVHTLAAQRAQQALAKRIRLGTQWWGFQDPQPQVAYALVEFLAEDRIAVMDQETIAVVRRHRFAQLLERPPRGGMCGDVGMQDTAGGVFHHDKDDTAGEFSTAI